jgi:hypothetical protein
MTGSSIDIGSADPKLADALGLLRELDPKLADAATAVITEVSPPVEPPGENRREVDAFVLRANTCRNPELAWRAADAPLWLRDVMIRRHLWLREVFPPQPPPRVSLRVGLRAARPPRRVHRHCRARRAVHRGVTRGPPDGDPDPEPEPLTLSAEGVP